MKSSSHSPAVEIAVVPTETGYLSTARNLAAKIQLPLIASLAEATALKFSRLLNVSGRGIGYQDLSATNRRPFYFDFSTGALGYRHKRVSRKQEQILSAVAGRNKLAGLKVLDCTAGLGRDAFVLATAGAVVTLYERSPIIACLLEDAIERGKKFAGLLEIFSRMSLQNQNVETILESLNGAGGCDYQVIYIDPMFPQRRKSAKIKRGMQIIQDLQLIERERLDWPVDDGGETIYRAALQLKVNRIVVKRPRAAPPLLNSVPSAQLFGRMNRFDIYS